MIIILGTGDSLQSDYFKEDWDTVTRTDVDQVSNDPTYIPYNNTSIYDTIYLDPYLDYECELSKLDEEDEDQGSDVNPNPTSGITDRIYCDKEKDYG